ncbi:hypothetical protein FOPE_05206 [Fonsecaea pedrosoi]|nr:hypothetical protein FOPE_05206 [Fonsecaea pedrosoi]
MGDAAVLMAQMEMMFKKLAVTLLPYTPPDSDPPNSSGVYCPTPTTPTPAVTARKFLQPRGHVRHSSTESFPALKLPAEIRLLVYRSFLTIPPEKAWGQCDKKHQVKRVTITLARKNLRRVCHQIAREWDPLFLSTTTMTIRNLLAGWDPLSGSNMLNKTPLTAFGEICRRGTEMVYNIPHTRRPGSALFQMVFLERQSLYKLNKNPKASIRY